MITIPSFQETTPSDTARAWQGGFAGGLEADRVRQSQKQLELSIKTAAQQYQARQQFEKAVQADVASGMPYEDATRKNIMMYGPLMFGSSAAGMYQMYRPQAQYQVYGPNGEPVSQPSPAKPVLERPAPLPTTVIGPGQTGQFPGHVVVNKPTSETTVVDSTGKPVGSPIAGNVRVLPQPHVAAPNYETVTTTVPGIKPQPAQVLPGVPASTNWFGHVTPAIPETVLKPAVPGTPTVRTSKRIAIPMGPTMDQDLTNAPSAAAAPEGPNPDDYKSVDDVKMAFKHRRITYEQAAKLLRDKFDAQ